MTSGGGGVADDRANALLKEAALTEIERRSAQVTLADRALIAADGDGAAAADMLREVLEATGFIGYEPVQQQRRVSNNPIVNYERPGA